MRFALLALLLGASIPACSSKSEKQEKPPPQPAPVTNPAPPPPAPPTPTLDGGAAVDPTQPDIVVPDIVIEK